MGDDDAWLRRRRLHDLSPSQPGASTQRLISLQAEIHRPPSGGLFVLGASLALDLELDGLVHGTAACCHDAVPHEIGPSFRAAGEPDLGRGIGEGRRSRDDVGRQREGRGHDGVLRIDVGAGLELRQLGLGKSRGIQSMSKSPHGRTGRSSAAANRWPG